MGEDSGGELYVLTRHELGPAGTSGQAFRIAAAS
jgi:hypothetical protein